MENKAINKHKGEVLVSLAGKEYKARLTIDAIMQIEDAVDMGIVKLAQKMSEGDLRMGHMIQVLLPALRGGGNDLQPKDVMELVQRHGLVQSMAVVAKVLTEVLSTGNTEVATEGKKQEED